MSENQPTQGESAQQDDLQLALEALEKFEIGLKQEDINRGIDCARAAVQSLLERNENPTDALTILGACLQRRYQTTTAKNIEDINEAAEAGRAAVERVIRGEHDHGPQVYMHNLQAILMFRFLESKDTAHLEDAFEIIRQLLNVAPQNGPLHALTLNMLCTLYSFGYNETKNEKYLEEAAIAAELAVSISPRKHPFRADMLEMLLDIKRIMYARDDSLENLDETIRVCKEIHEIHPPGHPNHLDLIHRLAASFTLRYRSTDNLDDLCKVIEYCQAALKIAPIDLSTGESSPAEERSIGALHTLRRHIQIYFERTGDVPELDEHVIDSLYLQSLVSDEDEKAIAQLRKLADAFHRVYEKTGRVVDIEYAIMVTLRAMALVNDTHGDWEAIQDSYRARYRLWSDQTGKMPDREIVVMGFGNGGSWIPAELADGLELKVPFIINAGELEEEAHQISDKVEGSGDH
ncbi:uncharacterized protein ACLA_043550 [Aspergillus clavatus NRRL 1]|uniref:Tetratricopeptide repeat domain protein n=1 Tax=Aspergillus clavatus (strain ATCC 1007 / CBS 513.65 / DSM 816 / NCTC 3887 / NRRL 1 / QM 1276 / 107) TaxID=344612 RepID=A1C8J9_ASPCL|nr:uncharacterized protein ACLA_043550 [Aspergillus clavatus NRRL 1]EAW13636.1 hypothetical protein ACLA_043550 [Aspergillus clavatus NRRL 1]